MRAKLWSKLLHKLPGGSFAASFGGCSCRPLFGWLFPLLFTVMLTVFGPPSPCSWCSFVRIICLLSGEPFCCLVVLLLISSLFILPLFVPPPLFTSFRSHITSCRSFALGRAFGRPALVRFLPPASQSTPCRRLLERSTLPFRRTFRRPISMHSSAGRPSVARPFSEPKLLFEFGVFDRLFVEWQVLLAVVVQFNAMFVLLFVLLKFVCSCWLKRARWMAAVRGKHRLHGAKQRNRPYRR